MSRFTFLKRGLAVITSAAFLTGATQALSFDARYESTMTIAPSTDYTTSYGQSNSQNVAVQQLCYSPTDAVSPVAVYGSKLYGASTIKTAAAFLSSQGESVVAGLNADFFSLQTGLPLGMVVLDGRLCSSDAGHTAIGFDANGKAIIGTPSVSITLSIEGTDQTIAIDHLNKLRTKYGLYLLTPDFSGETRVSCQGTDVLMEVVEGEPALGGSVTLQVVDMINSAISMAIPDNTYILSCDATGPTDRLTGLAVGQTVTIDFACSDERFCDVAYAVGGGDILLQDGAVSTGLETTRQPRSAAGITADGTVILVEVDGRSTVSAGMGLDELAAYFAQLGCVDAINLDGGGSSALLVLQPGQKTASVVNTPSDGSLRKCANYIFLVNNEDPTETPKLLHLYPANPVALVGGTISFSVGATDKNYYYTDLLTSVSLSADRGSIDDLTYTASRVGEDAVTAESGRISGTTKVTVIETPDQITLTNEATGSSVTGLTMSVGQSVNLHASASYANQTVYAQDESFDWSVSGKGVTVDEDGLVTVESASGATVTLTACAGDCKKTINITVSAPIFTKSTAETLDDFETLGFSADHGAQISLVSTLSYVGRGRSSLGIAYDLSEEDDALITADPSIQLPSGGGKVWALVYGDGSGNQLSLCIQTSTSNKELSLCDLTFEGWQWCSVSLPQSARLITGLKLKSSGTVNSGTILIDQLTDAALAAADTTPPVIQNLAVTLSGSNASVSGVILDETTLLTADQIVLSIDGTEIAVQYTAETGQLSATATLKNGVHRLHLCAQDAFGNICATTQDVRVEPVESANTFLDMGTHWAQPYAEYLSANGIATGEPAGNGYAYRPDRTLTRAEFATLLARFLQLDTSAYYDTPFADQNSFPSWAAGAIGALSEQGLISGRYVNGQLVFDYSASITRAEVMTILGKALGKGYSAASTSFSDSADIPSWATDPVNLLVQMGVVSGYEDGTLQPNRTVSRGEVARILFNLC